MKKNSNKGRKTKKSLIIFLAEIVVLLALVCGIFIFARVNAGLRNIGSQTLTQKPASGQETGTGVVADTSAGQTVSVPEESSAGKTAASGDKAETADNAAVERADSKNTGNAQNTQTALNAGAAVTPDPNADADAAEENIEVSRNQKLKGYTNIALIGIDTRDSQQIDYANSDTMIIASVNNDTGKVRMVSLYRDTLLNIGSKADAEEVSQGDDDGANWTSGEEEAVVGDEEILTFEDDGGYDGGDDYDDGGYDDGGDYEDVGEYEGGGDYEDVGEYEGGGDNYDDGGYDDGGYDDGGNGETGNETYEGDNSGGNSGGNSSGENSSGGNSGGNSETGNETYEGGNSGGGNSETGTGNYEENSSDTNERTEVTENSSEESEETVTYANNDTFDVATMSEESNGYTGVTTAAGRYDKANAAYANGSAKQLLSMLNKNFDLNIHDYVVVDFNGVAKLVDDIDGIDVWMTKQEIVHMNNYCQETSKVTGLSYEPIEPEEMPREYHLNGVQAVSYARIRYTTGNDMKRTQRQRVVIQKIVNKAKSNGIKAVNGMINDVFPMCKTSLSAAEIIRLASQMFSFEIEKTTGFPFEHIEKNVYVGSRKLDAVVPVTLAENVKELHEFLFDEENYQVSSTVAEYSTDIESLSNLTLKSRDAAVKNSVIGLSGGEADVVK